MDWNQIMLQSVKDLLKDGIDIFGEKQKAIDYAKKFSCAGKTTFDIAITSFFYGRES